MPSSALIRWGGLAAMVGGVLWALWYVGATLVGGENYQTYNRLMPVVLLLLMVGLVAFFVAQKGSHDRLLIKTGFVVALIGLLVMIAGNVVEFWAFAEEPYGASSLRDSAWMAFALGMFAFYMGTVLFGIGTLRARMLPRSGALLLIIWFPLGFVLSGLLQLVSVPEALAFSGLTALLGAGWAVLGYALWSAVGEVAQRSTRVR